MKWLRKLTYTMAIKGMERAFRNLTGGVLKELYQRNWKHVCFHERSNGY